MKRFLTFAAVAIVMASCTIQEEITTQSASPISFRSVTKKATKGGLDQNQLTAATNVYCSGLLHGSETSFHFQNALFTNDGSQNTWSSAATWPMDGTLDFWAYSCSDYKRGNNADGQYTKTENNVTPVSATFATTGEAADDKYSSLTLDFGNRLTGSTDVMVSNIVSAECAKHPTPALVFRHTMAWIVVAIQLNNNNTTSDAMKFYEVTLDGVKLSGSLTADASQITANNNWGSSDIDWAPVWTPFRAEGATEDQVTDKAFPAYTSTDGVTLGHALTDPVEGIMVLPQPQTSITIKYAYRDINGKYDNVLTHEINLTNDAENTYPDWKAGHKYIYTLTINPADAGKTIKFTSSVVNFSEHNYSFTL